MKNPVRFQSMSASIMTLMLWMFLTCGMAAAAAESGPLEVVNEYISKTVAPRMWQERHDEIIADVAENPDRYQAAIDRRFRLDEVYDLIDSGEREKDEWGVVLPVMRLQRLIELATHLGPEHGAQVLREFEAVLRTRREDRYWPTVLAHQRGADVEEIREMAIPRAVLNLHTATIEALAELDDRSLILFVTRSLAGDTPGARLGDAGRKYLLRAVRAGDAEARRWLEYLLEEHPNSFHDYTSRSRKWETKAREALAAGEAAAKR